MIFGWRKDSGEAEKPFEPQPEKAKKFFDHARTAGNSGQLEYALKLWANGLKFDPGNMVAHQAMYEHAVQYAQNGSPAAVRAWSKNFFAFSGCGSGAGFASPESPLRQPKIKVRSPPCGSP